MYPMSADDLAAALTTGASGWLVLSIAAILPDPVGVHAGDALRPAIYHPVPADA